MKNQHKTPQHHEQKGYNVFQTFFAAIKVSVQVMSTGFTPLEPEMSPQSSYSSVRFTRYSYESSHIS